MQVGMTTLVSGPRDAAFVRSSHGAGEDAVETAIRVEQAGFQTQA